MKAANFEDTDFRTILWLFCFSNTSVSVGRYTQHNLQLGECMTNLLTVEQQSRAPAGSTAGRVPEAALHPARPRRQRPCQHQHCSTGMPITGTLQPSHSSCGVLSFKKQYFHRNVPVLTAACCPVRVDNATAVSDCHPPGTGTGAGELLLSSGLTTCTSKVTTSVPPAKASARFNSQRLYQRDCFSRSPLCVITGT